MKKEILSVTEDEEKIKVRYNGSFYDCIFGISTVIIEMSKTTQIPVEAILEVIKKDIEYIRRD